MSNKTDGFTLIEVMVAVAVIALALPALMTTMFGYIDGTGYLRDKLQAQWVAQNKMAELRLGSSFGNSRESMTGQRGEQKLAGRTWYWKSRAKEFEQLEFAGVYGIEVSVWENEPEEDQSPLVTLVGIVRQPEQQAIARPAPERPPAPDSGNGDES